MNGAPANPMSGTGEAARMSRIASRSGPTAASGSKVYEAGDVAGGPDRCLDDRTDAGLDLERHPETGERGRDVGEEDRRVHPEPADRLEGDLGAEGRIPGDLDERGALPDGPELGQRAPGLTHEPDRGRVDRLAPAGAQVAVGPRVGGAPRPGVGAGSGLAGHLDRREHGGPGHERNAVRAASTVSATTSGSWAREMNQASNCEGGSRMPASSIAPKKRAKAARSDSPASA